MTEKSPDLRIRTKDFARQIIKLVDSLPRSLSTEIIGKQLLRSATSVGANYRSARRGRSTAEFCSKLGIVEEEADEAEYWLELLLDLNVLPKERLLDLITEAREILAMVVASIRTARANSSGGH